MGRRALRRLLPGGSQGRRHHRDDRLRGPRPPPIRPNPEQRRGPRASLLLATARGAAVRERQRGDLRTRLRQHPRHDREQAQAQTRRPRARLCRRPDQIRPIVQGVHRRGSRSAHAGGGPQPRGTTQAARFGEDVRARSCRRDRAGTARQGPGCRGDGGGRLVGAGRRRHARGAAARGGSLGTLRLARAPRDVHGEAAGPTGEDPAAGAEDREHEGGD